jgi:hypothetical protein
MSDAEEEKMATEEDTNSRTNRILGRTAAASTKPQALVCLCQVALNPICRKRRGFDFEFRMEIQA